jgi:hypothetical protein
MIQRVLSPHAEISQARSVIAWCRAVVPRLNSSVVFVSILNAVSSFYTYLGNVGAMHYHPAAKAARPKCDRQYSDTRSLTEPQARGMCALAPTAAARSSG